MTWKLDKWTTSKNQFINLSISLQWSVLQNIWLELNFESSRVQICCAFFSRHNFYCVTQQQLIKLALLWEYLSNMVNCLYLLAWSGEPRCIIIGCWTMCYCRKRHLICRHHHPRHQHSRHKLFTCNATNCSVVQTTGTATTITTPTKCKGCCNWTVTNIFFANLWVACTCMRIAACNLEYFWCYYNHNFQ